MFINALDHLVRVGVNGAGAISFMKRRETPVMNEVFIEEPPPTKCIDAVVQAVPILHVPTASTYIYHSPTPTSSIPLPAEQGVLPFNKVIPFLFIALVILAGVTVCIVITKFVRGAYTSRRRTTVVEDEHPSPTKVNLAAYVCAVAAITLAFPLILILVLSPLGFIIELLVLALQKGEEGVSRWRSATRHTWRLLHGKPALLCKPNSSTTVDPGRSKCKLCSANLKETTISPHLSTNEGRLSSQTELAQRTAPPVLDGEHSEYVTAVGFEHDGSTPADPCLIGQTRAAEESSAHIIVKETPSRIGSAKDSGSSSDSESLPSPTQLIVSVTVEFNGLRTYGSFAVATDVNVEMGATTSRPSFAFLPSVSTSSVHGNPSSAVSLTTHQARSSQEDLVHIVIVEASERDDSVPVQDGGISVQFPSFEELSSRLALPPQPSFENSWSMYDDSDSGLARHLPLPSESSGLSALAGLAAHAESDSELVGLSERSRSSSVGPVSMNTSAFEGFVASMERKAVEEGLPLWDDSSSDDSFSVPRIIVQSPPTSAVLTSEFMRPVNASESFGVGASLNALPDVGASALPGDRMVLSGSVSADFNGLEPSGSFAFASGPVFLFSSSGSFVLAATFKDSADISLAANLAIAGVQHDQGNCALVDASLPYIGVASSGSSFVLASSSADFGRSHGSDSSLAANDAFAHAQRDPENLALVDVTLPSIDMTSSGSLPGSGSSSHWAEVAVTGMSW